jgi:hypothetical protein
MTDFSLLDNGETANGLLMIIQEIETIMTAKPLDLITNHALFIDLDNYLFKHGVSTAQVALTVQNMLDSGVTNSLGFDIETTCEFFATEHTNDLLLVQIMITSNNVQQTMLEYAVTKTLQAYNLTFNNN